MDKEKYLENPCGTYALPFWKEKKRKLPENMRVIHEKEFENSYLNIYNDTTYFRLIHYLKDIDTIKLRKEALNGFKYCLIIGHRD